MPTSFDSTIFGADWDTDWHMQGGERATLLHLLSTIRPRVSIEIGTFRGGSLRPIAHFSRKTYTFDIDPQQHRLAPTFPTVEFVTGDTAETLPPVIESLSAGGAELDFVLVDGSHETDGVRHDIDTCLRYVPQAGPCVIVMHDSANPAVRAGILAAGWETCPHAHGLDVDFVPGALYGRADIRNQFWGGMAVGLLLPARRTGRLDIRDSFAHTIGIASRALAAGLVD
jgi:hypothetical protein